MASKSTTISKAIRILLKISNDSAASPIRKIASDLGIPASTVHRICQALAEEGILEFNAKTRQYQYGRELVRLSQAVFQTSEIHRRAIPILRRIVSKLNETAQLVLYDRSKSKIVFSYEETCDHPIQYLTPIGVPLPMYIGASGKSIMAFLPNDEVDKILNSQDIPEERRTHIFSKSLEKDLKEIRNKGYAITFGERTPDTIGVGVPIFNSGGDVIGGIVLTMPAYRYKASLEKEIVKYLRDGGEQLSRNMGLPPSMKYPVSENRDWV